MKYTGLYDERIADQNVPIVNAAKITQDKQLRLSTATPLLAALIQSDSVISLSGGGNNDEFTLIVRAIEYADLLINEINETKNN